jgi:hypothetical protein
MSHATHTCHSNCTVSSLLVATIGDISGNFLLRLKELGELVLTFLTNCL